MTYGRESTTVHFTITNTYTHKHYSNCSKYAYVKELFAYRIDFKFKSILLPFNTINTYSNTNTHVDEVCERLNV